MPRFAPGATVVTDSPEVVVEGGLPAGVHRFRLEARGLRGETLAVATIAVRVVERGDGLVRPAPLEQPAPPPGPFRGDPA
jgi:hypothetical protein